MLTQLKCDIVICCFIASSPFKYNPTVGIASLLVQPLSMKGIISCKWYNENPSTHYVLIEAAKYLSQQVLYNPISYREDTHTPLSSICGVLSVHSNDGQYAFVVPASLRLWTSTPLPTHSTHSTHLSPFSDFLKLTLKSQKGFATCNMALLPLINFIRSKKTAGS